MNTSNQYSKEVISEAAMIVAKEYNTTVHFVMERYTTTQLFREVRKIRKAREANMDSVRENW